MKLDSKTIHSKILDAARHIEAYRGFIVGEDVVSAMTERYSALSERLPPLRPRETGAVAFLQPKVAALCFDRIWGVHIGLDDPEIAFGWQIPVDPFAVALMEFLVASREVEPAKPPESEGVSDQKRAILARTDAAIASAYRNIGCHRVSPLYASLEAQDGGYRPGDNAAVVALLDNLNVVDEGSLNWEQVREFRRDADSRSAYRAFVHWLDRDMLGRSSTFVVDEVEERLLRYERALRKHGMKTVTGALSHTLEAKYLAGVGAIGAAMDFIMSSPVWALAAGGLLIAGRTALEVAKTKVEREDIENAHRDIAFVHAVKTRFGQ